MPKKRARGVDVKVQFMAMCPGVAAAATREAAVVRVPHRPAGHRCGLEDLSDLELRDAVTEQPRLEPGHCEPCDRRHSSRASVEPH